MCYRRIVEQSNTVTHELDPAAAGSEIRLRTVSVVEAAADALRQMVLDGTLEPGARLRETEFAAAARHRPPHVPRGDPDPDRGGPAAARAATGASSSRSSSRRTSVDIFRLREALELEAVAPGDRAPATSRWPPPKAAVEHLNGAPGRRPLARGRRRRHGASTGRSSTRPAASAWPAPTRGSVGDPPLHGPAAPPLRAPAEVALSTEELLAPIVAGDADLAEELFRVHLEEAEANQRTPDASALQAREEVTA